MKRMKKIYRINIYILISGGLITGMKNLFHVRWAYNRGETITEILWYLIFSMIPTEKNILLNVYRLLNKGAIKLNKAIL